MYAYMRTRVWQRVCVYARMCVHVMRVRVMRMWIATEECEREH